VRDEPSSATDTIDLASFRYYGLFSLYVGSYVFRR